MPEAPRKSSPLVEGVWFLVSRCNLSSPLGAHPGLGSDKGRGRESEPPSRNLTNGETLASLMDIAVDKSPFMVFFSLKKWGTLRRH